MSGPRAPAPASAAAIRRLDERDAAAWLALRLEGFTLHPREFRIAPEDERGMPPAAAAGRIASAHVIGAFDDDALVGVAGLTRFDGVKLRHRGLLWGMYVRRAARGRGLGEALVRTLLEEAARQRIEQVLLTVAAGNDGALRLYERCGFVRYGLEPRAIRNADGYVDEVLMLCSVPPGGRAARPPR